ncbi:MAG: hypothetical protein HC932_00005 [Thermales bacterium]|nr:hypothetical protein [Thermales bacterium]
MSLKGDITKELYLFLNKRRFNKNDLRIDINILAFEKLGMSRNLEGKLFKVRQVLRKAHKELLVKGFLKIEPQFIKESSGEYLYYQFKGTPTLESKDEVVEQVEEMLLQIGLTGGQIAKLLKNHTNEQVKDAIELFNLQKSGSIKHPTKWLFACLSKDFDLTELDESRNKKAQIEKDEKELVLKKEKELKEDKKKRDLAKEMNDMLSNWIANNSFRYYTLCNEYIEQEKASNSIIYKSIRDKARKDKVSEMQVVMDNKMFNSPVKAQILKKIS